MIIMATKIFCISCWEMERKLMPERNGKRSIACLFRYLFPEVSTMGGVDTDQEGRFRLDEAKRLVMILLYFYLY